MWRLFERIGERCRAPLFETVAGAERTQCIYMHMPRNPKRDIADDIFYLFRLLSYIHQQTHPKTWRTIYSTVAHALLEKEPHRRFCHVQNGCVCGCVCVLLCLADDDCEPKRERIANVKCDSLDWQGACVLLVYPRYKIHMNRLKYMHVVCAAGHPKHTSNWMRRKLHIWTLNNEQGSTWTHAFEFGHNK